MGSLNTVKRVPLAIKVIAWLRDNEVDASLHIYGRFGNDQTVIARTIRELGLGRHVTLYGEIPPREKNKIYRHHNCYIQLSAHEGMAMSVVEAMQQGMLCVVTPVGEIPNYAHEGVSAIMMHVENGVICEHSLQNLLDTLNDGERCMAISSAAHRRFKGAAVFADSLVKTILIS